MAQLSSIASSRRSPAKASSAPARRATALRSADPVAVVESLAADCWAASEVVATDRFFSREAETLRQSARELALLADACGSGVLAVTSAAPTPARAALGFVISSYRLALEAALPRAVREVLRAQLERLVQADEQRQAA